MRARLLLLAAALTAFGGSLLGGFHLDDYAIFSGPFLKPVHGPYPLTGLTFWLNYQLGGQDYPLGYHAVNLLLHLGAALLAYECLRRLLPPAAALIAAAIFAVHPLQAEAVNEVAMRSVMLAALFCFAALAAWLQRRPWLALASFAVALLADRQCVAFPVLLLFLGHGWQSEHPPQPLPTVDGQAAPPARPIGDRPGGSRIMRISLACMGLLGLAAAARLPWGPNPLALAGLRFLRLLVLPWGFTLAPYVHEPLWLTITSAIAIAAVCAWKWVEKSGLESALTWFCAGLVLLMPSFSPNPAADPRMYLPMFAFAAAAGLLLARIPARAVAIALVLVLVALGVNRTYVWMSDERLWREAVSQAPDQVDPKIQLAKSLRAGDALELLARARQLAPYNPEVPAEIGRVLLDEGQFEGALDELSRAVALNPKNALAFNNRGVALAALGQTPAARADFEHALALDPKLAEARENLNRLTAR